MKRHLLSMVAVLSSLTIGTSALAQVEPAEIFCTIRESGGLNCQWLGKDRKSMTPEDISAFIDQASIAAYMTVKSRKGNDRTMFVDGSAAQFRRLSDIKKTASISEVSKAKNDLFTELEKKAIKLSDELDAMAASAELLKYDPAIGTDKAKRDMRTMSTELEGYRKNRDKVCTSTPAFEQMSKANASLQQSLSNILYAFQTPNSCMGDFKVFKDKDGTVDLRQLDTVAQRFQERCKK